MQSWNNARTSKDGFKTWQHGKIPSIIVRSGVCTYSYVDTARRIVTAEELCRLMQEYIALDVLLLTENEHSIETADPLERAEILRRWQPYFEQLPEYEYLREELTSEWP